MAGIMVILDFDKTIIEVDSDNWVVDELGATDLFNELLPTMSWNSLMETMMKEMHAKGTTIEEIKDVLKRVPIHHRVVPAIKTAHALGCDLRIVSDANMFFIETILDHLGIRNCFSEIHSNPSFINGEGRLIISPYVDFLTSAHGCNNLCPPNMCKGMIIERIQANEGKKKMIYLGDGVGDFCPSLKLKEGDFMMPRNNFPVWKLICENRAILKAEIFECIDGKELEQILIGLIEKIKIEEANNEVQLLSAVDCKFETVPIVAHEAFPPPLRVHH